MDQTAYFSRNCGESISRTGLKLSLLYNISANSFQELLIKQKIPRQLISKLHFQAEFLSRAFPSSVIICSEDFRVKSVMTATEVGVRAIQDHKVIE